METVNVEYKRELTDGLEREVVAFLNTVGGKIYIGADDNGGIVGISNADKLALSITDRIKNNILPSAMGIFNVDKCVEQDKTYIVITVAQGLEKPYYLKRVGMTPAGCFLRIGSQTTQMTQSQINGLYSRRVINTLHNVVSPNQQLTFTQLKIFYEGQGFDVSGEYFIRNLDLLTEDGKYNYAAYLLADNNGTSIKVARFRGTDKTDIVERNEYGRCCLVKAAKNVLERLAVANNTVVRVGGAAQRREITLVNTDALREAVLNAILHNDYINGAYPVVEIYDDRIEVVSSGGLPIGMSTNEFFAGRSLPRNKELMRIFSDLDMCEQLGSGMRKILRAYSKDIFDISEHFVSVVFRYNPEAMKILEQNQSDNVGKADNVGVNGGVNVGVNVGVKLSQNAQKVFEYISQNGSATAVDLAKQFNRNPRTIERAIKELRENGLIERVGSDKNGYYKLK